MGPSLPQKLQSEIHKEELNMGGIIKPEDIKERFPHHKWKYHSTRERENAVTVTFVFSRE